MENINYLEEIIYKYIKKHQDHNLDSLDIISHFKLHDTLITLSSLEEKNRIKYEYVYGVNYRYIVC